MLTTRFIAVLVLSFLLIAGPAVTVRAEGMMGQKMMGGEKMEHGGMMSGSHTSESMMAYHGMMQDMMGMMKEMMGILKDMSHNPSTAQKNKLDDMMQKMDGMMKMHNDMMNKKMME